VECRTARLVFLGPLLLEGLFFLFFGEKRKRPFRSFVVVFCFLFTALSRLPAPSHPFLPMDFTHTKHLYARFGFGLTPSEYHRWSHGRWEDALEDLFARAAEVADLEGSGPPLDETMAEGQMEPVMAEKNMPERRPAYTAGAQWIRRMADPAASALREKMALFWHGHFACEPRLLPLAFRYGNTLRRHALGSFRDLLLAMAQDAAMIRYLNNQQNRKNSPNENFARELLELFTMGHGHYTEQDIKEAARAFTGWSSGPDGDFLFREKQHDFGLKTFLGRLGNWNGEDIVNIILEQKETARWVTARMWRFWVGEKPAPEVLEFLSGVFYASGYNIERLLRALAEHPAFYQPENMTEHIKSPVELLVGLMRNVGIGFPTDESLALLQRALGQVLFVPPNVAGWPGGRTWIDNSSLLLRLNLGPSLMLAGGLDLQLKEAYESPERHPQLKRIDSRADLSSIRELLAPYPPERHEAVLVDFLLPGRAPAALEDLRRRAAAEPDPDRRLALLVLGILSFPEYQLT
jgi:hypothetical protein